MPRPYPKEFREDVIRVARNRGEGVLIKDIAADFGISESCLTNWLTQADHDDGCAQDRPPMITPRTARAVGGPRFSSRRTRCRAGRGHATNRRLTLVEFEATITPPATQAA